MVTDYLKDLEGSFLINEFADFCLVHQMYMDVHKHLTLALLAVRTNTVSYIGEQFNPSTKMMEPKKITSVRIDAGPQLLRHLDDSLKIFETRFISSINGKDYTLTDYLNAVEKGKIPASKKFKELAISYNVVFAVIKMHYTSIYKKNKHDSEIHNIVLTTENVFDADDRIKRCLNPLKDELVDFWYDFLTCFTSSIEYIKTSGQASDLTNEEKEIYNSTNSWVFNVKESMQVVIDHPVYDTKMEEAVIEFGGN